MNSAVHAEVKRSVLSATASRGTIAAEAIVGNCAVGAPSGRTLEFWFDFSSPYAYFASHSIGAVAERTGCRQVWRPFLLGVAFKATGMAPLSRTPLRGDYARRDWDRLSRRMKAPFRLPPQHPIAALAASRAFYWVEIESPERAQTFASRLFRAYFAEGRDIGDPDCVAAIGGELGLAADRLREAFEEPRFKAVLRAATDEALSRGVFGSPFFFADGEPFWGGDRLSMAEDWLRLGGW
jgi:2-hydroxychromene-2-carboxylate isomerase